MKIVPTLFITRKSVGTIERRYKSYIEGWSELLHVVEFFIISIACE